MEKNSLKKNIFFKNMLKLFLFFSLKHPRPSISVHKKCQPNWSSRLAGYTQHLYINLACLSGCLFVCLYPINVKTAEPIRPNFLWDIT